MFWFSIKRRRLCAYSYWRGFFPFLVAKWLFGDQGDGAVVRALASHQCGPGSNPGVDAMCGLSLLLVLSLALRGFSPGTPVFPSPQKPTFPNSCSTRNQVDEEPLCGCATSKSLFIYLFIYLLNFKNLITSSRHYDILVKTRRRMTTDDVGSRARTN